MKKYVSIDIGGTAIKHGIIGENADIIVKGKMPTEAQKGGPGIMEKVVRIIERYRKDYELSGICISTAGMVDVEKGEIFYSAPLIPDYAGTKIKEELEKRFSIPCEVENDVNCAGLAENVSGAAKGSRITLCLTIGTGIGGCILIDGEVFHGFGGSACEVGYMYMDGSDFQTLGAASILTKKVAAKKRRPQEEWNGYRIFEAAKQGDTVCLKAIDEMTDVLGKGIANICYVLNPQTVVLGGGIMAQEGFLKPRIQESIRRYLISDIADKTAVVFAKYQNDAGMLGAYYHFQKQSGTGRF